MTKAHLRRVLVIDDHATFTELLDLALTRSGYQALTEPLPSCENHVQALLRKVRRAKPTAVLLSLNLVTFREGVKLIRPLAETGVPIVVSVDHHDRARYGQCLAAGARQVIGRDQKLSDLISTLRRLGEHQPVLGIEERTELIRCWHQHAARTAGALDRLGRLSAREAEVLTELMYGRTVTEIARRNVVSVTTVRAQVRNILAKLDVSTQHVAVSLAYRVSWRTDLESV